MTSRWISPLGPVTPTIVQTPYHPTGHRPASTGPSAELLHNRSAHSVKAAQLGRRIAERLIKMDGAVARFLDPDVVEASCLGHDLGLPPFGHIGEAELHRLLAPIGGFEGNAQTLRLLTKLSVKGDGPGLDLTRATLNAVIKYPELRTRDLALTPHDWTDRRYGDKAGVYLTEAEFLQWCREGLVGTARTPEATLMDWADDVTYAVHDLEDFFQAGLVPLDRFTEVKQWIFAHLLARADKWKGFSRSDAHDALERLEDEVSMGRVAPYSDSIEHRSLLRQVVSKLLTRYVNAVEISGDAIYVDRKAQYEVVLLKEMTRFFVIDSPPLRLKQMGQVLILRRVFLSLWELILTNEDDPPVAPALKTHIKLAEEDHEGAGRYATTSVL